MFKLLMLLGMMFTVQNKQLKCKLAMHAATSWIIAETNKNKTENPGFMRGVVDGPRLG